VAAVTDYYALLPGNRDAAWPRMTSEYQQNHAFGRGAYDSFWSEVQRVEVTDVVATGPGTVEATIAYVRASGTDVERTAYTFVVEAGILKIAATVVL
jgi:hypothetical protein